MTQASFGGQLLDSSKGEIFEGPNRNFGFREEYIDRHAAVQGARK